MVEHLDWNLGTLAGWTVTGPSLGLGKIKHLTSVLWLTNTPVMSVMSVIPVMSDLQLLGPILGAKMSQCLSGSGCSKDQENYD